MGTKALPMPSVLSLIFPIEAAGSESSTKSCASHHHSTDSLAKQLKKLTRPRTAYEKQLKADVTYFRRQLTGSSEAADVDIVDLACSLTALGHEVKVRYAEGGGPNCFRNLFHEFLLVKGKADCAGTEIIIETSFSEHFLIPCATPAYSSFYENLPPVFVGPIHQMAPLVEIISHEMSKSFTEAGVTMPPWRGSRAIMSKWAPQKATDRLPSEAASPRGTSSSTSVELDKPPALSAHKRDPGADKGEEVSAGAEDRRGSTGNSHAREKFATCETNTTKVGSIGTVPAPDGTRAAGVHAAQARHLRRSSGGGSPALSIKVGFDFPGQRAK